ncbi:MAG: winged helix-turn-helix domain-containing protein [Candidatus Bathyarchaeia archaeon]
MSGEEGSHHTYVVTCDRGAYRKILELLKASPDPLFPCEIAEKTKLNRSSVRKYVRNLWIKGLIFQAYLHGPYADSPQKLRYPLSHSGQLLRSAFEEFLDLKRLRLESGRVRFRVEKSTADRLRAYIVVRYGVEPGSRDPAGQVSFRHDWTLTVCRNGAVWLHYKSPWFLKSLPEWLDQAGLDEAHRDRFLHSLTSALEGLEGTAEIPLLFDGRGLKGVKVCTSVGERDVITSRVNFSGHHQGELSVSGQLLSVFHFLGILAGQQHFSPLEFLQAVALLNLDRRFEAIAAGYEALLEWFKASLGPSSQSGGKSGSQSYIS